jgi:hypothetical protein
LKEETWVLMKITAIKPTPTNNAQTRIYYEMCDSSEKKVAGAITVPVASNTQMPDFKTVVLSTLDLSEVDKALREAGLQP